MFMLHRGRLAAGVVLAAAGLLVAPGTLSAADNYKGYERGDALITVQELKQLIDAKDPKLVILAVANVAEYRLPGHIPGGRSAPGGPTTRFRKGRSTRSRA